MRSRIGMRCRAARLGTMLICGLAFGACTPKAAPPAPMPQLSDKSPVPMCRIEGCCQGHGNVAYMQPDKIIMCTDGQPSEICDCH